MQSNKNFLPQALVDLIDAFNTLPGVGQKTAERYAYACLKGSDKNNQKLASSLSKIKSGVKLCPVTFALIDQSSEVSPPVSYTHLTLPTNREV